MTVYIFFGCLICSFLGGIWVGLFGISSKLIDIYDMLEEIYDRLNWKEKNFNFSFDQKDIKKLIKFN